MGSCTLPYDAIIFDLDGTLTDSEQGIVNSVQYALEKMNMPMPERDVMRTFIGPPLYDSFRSACGMTDQDARQAIDYFVERGHTIGYLENRVYTGLPAMLKALKENGAYLAVATAKPHPVCDYVLEAFDLIKYFDYVAAPNGEDESSDKARLIRAALPKSYRRACMVGDRKYDMAAGVSCNMDSIGILYGCGTREELETSGATHILDTVSDLTKFLLGDKPLLPGTFLSLEGSDGCGKSTQHKLIAQWLEDCGHNVVVTREPGGCPIAERIREIVLDKHERGMIMTDECEALLFAAARAQHVSEVIAPAIARGDIVLCDRFVDSSAAYQGIGRGLGADWVRAINAPGIGDHMPDKTIFLDIDPDLAMQRRIQSDTLDRIEKAKGDLPRRVYEAYREMAADDDERFLVIDADGIPEEVLLRIKRALMTIL